MSESFWSQRVHDFLKSRIAAEWTPKGVQFQATVVGVTGHAHEFLYQLDGPIVVAAPHVNLGETFQDQRAIVNIFRNRHQIDRVLRFADGQIFLAQSRVNLSEDSNSPRVFRFDDQSLLQNFSTLAKRSHCTC